VSAGGVLSADDLAELVLGRYMEERNQFLSDEARSTSTVMRPKPSRRGSGARRDGVDGWLQSMELRESGWVGVIDRNLQSLEQRAAE
jgi:two-component system sensor histidine kinase PfeS